MLVRLIATVLGAGIGVLAGDKVVGWYKGKPESGPEVERTNSPTESKLLVQVAETQIRMDKVQNEILEKVQITSKAKAPSRVVPPLPKAPKSPLDPRIQALQAKFASESLALQTQIEREPKRSQRRRMKSQHNGRR